MQRSRPDADARLAAYVVRGHATALEEVGMRGIIGLIVALVVIYLILNVLGVL